MSELSPTPMALLVGAKQNVGFDQPLMTAANGNQNAEGDSLDMPDERDGQEENN